MNTRATEAHRAARTMTESATRGPEPEPCLPPGSGCIAGLPSVEATERSATRSPERRLAFYCLPPGCIADLSLQVIPLTRGSVEALLFCTAPQVPRLE